MESIIPNQVNPPPPSPNFQRPKSPNQWNNPNQGYPQPGNRNQSMCLGLKLLSGTGTNDQISTTAAASNVVTLASTACEGVEAAQEPALHTTWPYGSRTENEWRDKE
ncbi:hypothetical protein ACFX2I_024524 [Malus domestica]